MGRYIVDTNTFRLVEYAWQSNGVFCDELLPHKNFYAYTTEEINVLFENKANKTGQTDTGNIALLDTSGDLVDSGVHPADLYFNVIDGGIF